MNYYLAIDIGATSGRAILGFFKDNEINLEEIYRFDGYLIKKDDHLFWDTKKIYEHMLIALKKCKELNKRPFSLGIDTFGVDYALLDKNNKLIRDIYSYKDHRTIKSKKELERKISINELYSKTGIAPQVFNTIYQLYDDKMNNLLDKVDSIMFLPCYLGYLLTGVKYNELSIASTSGLINKNSFDYDNEILDLLNLKKDHFAPFKKNHEVIGNLKEEIIDIVGFDLKVVNVISHDTGTGVYGSKVNIDEMFLSSGTWSLIGVLKDNYDTSNFSLDFGFTNELNDINKVRYLKNIVGMNIVNSVNNEQKEVLPITQVVELAKKGIEYKNIFDPTLNEFLSPESMEKEIYKYFDKKKIYRPSNLSELYFCIYNSLAHAYAKSIREIEEITNHKYKKIVIFGGGSKNQFLNELTAKLSGLEVIVGPSEATSIGNIMCQVNND